FADCMIVHEAGSDMRRLRRLAAMRRGGSHRRGHRVRREERTREGTAVLLVAVCVSCVFAISAGRPRPRARPPEPTARALAQPVGSIERGKFVLHKFEQAIGEETYQITRDGETWAAKMDFKFVDRGTEVPLTATLQTAQDLTPTSFEIKGKTSRQSTI